VIRALALGAIAALLAGPAAAQPATPPWSEPAPASTYVPGPRGDMLIAGANVLDGAGGRFIGDVLVREGRIAAVGPSLPRPPGVAVVEAEGRWLTPGLVDVHTHYGTYLLPRVEVAVDDVLERSDPNVADTWIEHAVRPVDPAFARALSRGVTTVQILPGSGALFSGRTVVVKPVPAATLAAMRFPGARQGLKMACGDNPAGAFGERGRAPNSRQGEIAIVRRELMDAERYAAEWEEHLEEHGRDGPPKGKSDDRRDDKKRRPKRGPKRDLKNDTLVAALRGELPVHLHCYRAEDIATWIDVLDEFGLKITAVHHATEAYKIAPLLAEKKVCAALWADWWGFKREAEDGVPENAAFVDTAGGCVAMHSDIPLIGGHLNLEAAKAMGSGRRAGIVIPPETAIRWITSNAAGMLGLGDRIGRIAPGYNADLVLWSADPFSAFAHAERVWVDGALRHQRGQAYTPDVELGRPQAGPSR
jgi:imidazolonepropionase-like amidohydrolase